MSDYGHIVFTIMALDQCLSNRFSGTVDFIMVAYFNQQSKQRSGIEQRLSVLNGTITNSSELYPMDSPCIAMTPVTIKRRSPKRTRCPTAFPSGKIPGNLGAQHDLGTVFTCT